MSESLENAIVGAASAAGMGGAAKAAMDLGKGIAGLFGAKFDRPAKDCQDAGFRIWKAYILAGGVFPPEGQGTGAWASMTDGERAEYDKGKATLFARYKLPAFPSLAGASAATTIGVGKTVAAGGSALAAAMAAAQKITGTTDAAVAEARAAQKNKIRLWLERARQLIVAADAGQAAPAPGGWYGPPVASWAQANALSAIKAGTAPAGVAELYSKVAGPAFTATAKSLGVDLGRISGTIDSALGKAKELYEQGQEVVAGVHSVASTLSGLLGD